jgi:hypothetical protein
MTTGNFWDVTNPLKPVGPFDVDGVYDIPFDWADWLAGLDPADSYASHTFELDAGLQEVTSAHALGVITIRVQASGTPALVIKQKYGITCHITTTNGQKEDMTLYLKAVEK